MSKPRKRDVLTMTVLLVITSLFIGQYWSSTEVLCLHGSNQNVMDCYVETTGFFGVRARYEIRQIYEVRHYPKLGLISPQVIDFFSPAGQTRISVANADGSLVAEYGTQLQNFFVSREPRIAFYLERGSLLVAVFGLWLFLLYAVVVYKYLLR